MPARSVDVNPGAGRATLSVANLAQRDFFNLPNALAVGRSVPAVVTFEIVWSGVRRRFNVRDAQNGFAGEFVENGRATIVWRADQAGFRFVSAAANTSTSTFAQIGHERNGVFFPAAGNR